MRLAAARGHRGKPMNLKRKIGIGSRDRFELYGNYPLQIQAVAASIVDASSS
jgi:hypothetical protein